MQLVQNEHEGLTSETKSEMCPLSLTQISCPPPPSCWSPVGHINTPLPSGLFLGSCLSAQDLKGLCPLPASSSEGYGTSRLPLQLLSALPPPWGCWQTSTPRQAHGPASCVSPCCSQLFKRGFDEPLLRYSECGLSVLLAPG